MNKIAMLLLCIFALFLVGCQNAGQVVETSESPFCTSCKTETKTTFIKGLNNKIFKCPKCETEVDYDENGEDRILHTCTKCGRALEKCPTCKEQEG